MKTRRYFIIAVVLGFILFFMSGVVAIVYVYTTRGTSGGVVNKYNSPLSNKQNVNSLSLSSFKCHGTCSCNDERRNANVLTKSLSFAVSAFSLIMAVNVAKGLFEQKCEDSLKSSGCSEESIQSQVKFCEDVENAETNADNLPAGYARKREYFCEGNCMDPEDEVDEEKGYECKNSRFVNVVYIDFLDKDLEYPLLERETRLKPRAKNAFEDSMEEWCEEHKCVARMEENDSVNCLWTRTLD